MKKLLLMGMVFAAFSGTYVHAWRSYDALRCRGSLRCYQCVSGAAGNQQFDGNVCSQGCQSCELNTRR